MADSSKFALHRPELTGSLLRGEQAIIELMAGSARAYPADFALIPADTEHEFVYRLKSGWVGRTRTLEDGREQSILIFLPGDLFAVKSMFINRHPDTVRVLSDAVIERADYQRLHQAFSTNADVASRCAWQIVEEERRLHNWVVGLGQGSAEERMAMLLVEFHERLSTGHSIKTADLRYEMPLTQAQVADHLGITNIHVNRVLRVFREQNIVTVRDGQVIIHNLARLGEIAKPLLDPHDRAHVNTARNAQPAPTAAPAQRADSVASRDP